MSTYTRVHVLDVRPEKEEFLTDLAFEFGASGIAENLKFSQPDLTYDPIVLDQGAKPYDLFFQATPSDAFFERLKSLDTSSKYEVFVEEEKDWLEDWKKGYTSFELVPGTWVVPSWETPLESAKKVIRIDPGMAFGTGTHATTQCASRLIVKSIKELGGTPSLIDVGTGTGILAMLAHQQGAGPIVGIEIDTIARDVARENLELNQMSSIQVPDLDLSEVTEQYDIVVANIIDGVLTQLKGGLMNCLKPQGQMILSGILVEREAVFNKSFLTGDVEVLERITQDEWVALRLQKKSVARFPMGVIEH
ncbi:MAG: 50S ribosomal protein L11 methyltransferase [Bdellovibrionales bacterium]|nr:50S ribosomal protein L11 methyltransferase [Bdellovibrionales bacterium]